jgi:ankyrin repeat protein
LVFILCSGVACSKRRLTTQDDGLRLLYGRPWQVALKATSDEGEVPSKATSDILFVDGDRHLYLDKSGAVVDQGRFKALGAKRMAFRTPKGHIEVDAVELTSEHAVLKGTATMYSLVDATLQVEIRLTATTVPIRLPVPASLHEAATLGDIEAIGRLLAGDNVDKLQNGSSPLMAASHWCHPGAVRRLLDAGAKTNLVSESEETALILAAQSGDADVISALLAKKADPSVRSAEDKLSALVIVLQKGNLDAVRALVEGGAPLDDRDQLGDPLLCIAAMGDPLGNREFADVVSYLLEKKMDVNQRCASGGTPLFRAVEGDFAKTFSLLLDHGADPKLTDGAERTLEETVQAAPRGAPKILKILEKQRSR